MSYSLNSLKGGYIGSTIGVLKGDTRCLDSSSYETPPHPLIWNPSQYTMIYHSGENLIKGGVGGRGLILGEGIIINVLLVTTRLLQIAETH